MPKTISVVTYNIQHGNQFTKIVNNISKLAENGVNVFCLQEVRQNTAKQPFIVDALLNKLGPFWKAEYMIKPSSFDLGLCTIWDASKLTCTGFNKILLPKLERLKIHETLFSKWRSKKERVSPLFRIGTSQRAALIGHFNFEGSPLTMVNLHLDWQGGFKQRSKQLSHLAAALSQFDKNAPQILCGDFNTLGFYKLAKGQIKKVAGTLGETYVQVLNNKRTTVFPQMLDHIFVKNLMVRKAEVLKLPGSDHFPVMAQINI